MNEPNDWEGISDADLTLPTLRHTLGLGATTQRKDNLFLTRQAQHLLLYRLFDISNRVFSKTSELVPVHPRRPFALESTHRFVSSLFFFAPSFFTGPVR